MIKRKTFFSILLTLILAFMLSIPSTAFAKNQSSTDHTSEYADFGITKKDNSFFYKNKRIRIFFDERKDHSFEYSFVDINGTVDVRLLRNNAGNICKLKIISKRKAKKILKDTIGFVPNQPSVNTKQQKKTEYTDIKRCQLTDIPTNIKKVIAKKCTKNKWYTIQSSNKKYIYFKKAPKNFAYQITGRKIQISDIGKKKKGRIVLLSVGSDFNFTLTYNSKPVNLTVLNLS